MKKFVDSDDFEWILPELKNTLYVNEANEINFLEQVSADYDFLNKELPEIPELEDRLKVKFPKVPERGHFVHDFLLGLYRVRLSRDVWKNEESNYSPREVLAYFKGTNEDLDGRIVEFLKGDYIVNVPIGEYYSLEYFLRPKEEGQVRNVRANRFKTIVIIIIVSLLFAAGLIWAIVELCRKYGGEQEQNKSPVNSLGDSEAGENNEVDVNPNKNQDSSESHVPLQKGISNLDSKITGAISGASVLGSGIMQTLK